MWLWAALWLGITNYFCLFLFSGLFWGNPCEDIHPVKMCEIDCRKIVFEQELASYGPVFLQSSCSDSAECKFEKVWAIVEKNRPVSSQFPRKFREKKTSTCSCDLEIKTGKFLLFRKTTWQSILFLLLEFWCFLCFRSEQRLVPSSQPWLKGCRVALDSSSRNFARVDILQMYLHLTKPKL